MRWPASRSASKISRADAACRSQINAMISASSEPNSLASPAPCGLNTETMFRFIAVSTLAQQTLLPALIHSVALRDNHLPQNNKTRVSQQDIHSKLGLA